MISKKLGDQAEADVARFLLTKGYEIVDRNWRTRWCEIDIIAVKDDQMHFVEVKFRSSEAWGDGLDYITSKKQKQMRYAAEFWSHSHNWEGDALLSAAAVDRSGRVTFIENINE